MLKRMQRQCLLATQFTWFAIRMGYRFSKCHDVCPYCFQDLQAYRCFVQSASRQIGSHRLRISETERDLVVSRGVNASAFQRVFEASEARCRTLDENGGADRSRQAESC